MITISYMYGEYGDVYKSLISNIPKGKYFDNRAEIVPSEEISYFEITTDSPNTPHYVSVSRESDAEQSKKLSFSFVPDSTTYYISIPLGRGLNSIGIAASTDNVGVTSVVSTYFGTILMSYAKEIYKYSYKKINQVSKDIYLLESTRLASPILSFSKELPDNNTLRIFGLQTIIRSLINYPGTIKSLEDICKGFFISTPLLENIIQNDIFDSANPFYAGQEYELGKLINLWIRNSGIIRKQYLTALMVNDGDDISYSDDKTIASDDGVNNFDDSDEVYYPEDISDDIDLEIELNMEIELPRLDRNLPIPFTNIHPWCDRIFSDREHLDSETSLDIAMEDDPFETGRIGKQCIPYKYDGTKAISINKVVQIHGVPSKQTLVLNIGLISLGSKILTELGAPILTENGDYIITEN
jgi:hypothetical protein